MKLITIFDRNCDAFSEKRKEIHIRIGEMAMNLIKIRNTEKLHTHQQTLSFAYP